MCYEEVISDIMGRRRFGSDPGVVVSGRLLEKLGHPEKDFRIIHIAGTNGKGSVANYTAGILIRAGHRTGLFTSPHLMDFCERIRVDGDKISHEDVCRLYGVIASLGDTPTMFDFSFLLAMLYFREQGVEYAVIETGLGGRLDSTNAITRIPEVCAITSIGLDHTEVLGCTIEDIAREKAGIIKPGTQVVIGDVPREAMRVIRDRCDELLVRQVIEAPVADIRDFPGRNLAITYEVIKLLGLNLGHDIIERLTADKRVYPGTGRFQMIGDDPVFYVDGAHNPRAARALIDTIETAHPGAGATFLLGALKGHDTAGVIGELRGVADGFFSVGVRDERAYSAHEIGDMIRAVGADCIECEKLSSAVAEASMYALRHGTILVACGSLYLVGEILLYMERRDEI